jgi:predicted Zn-dependent protease
MLRKVLLILFLIFCLAKKSYAGINLIRDAQTEKFLRDLSNPVFKAAGLNSKDIKIYIINDDSINAFVAGGQNLFINTGLIRKFETPDALIGVVAHESGHIASGHLARQSEGSEGAQRAMMLSYLLGISAMIGGSPDAGMALILGGSQTAQRLFMKFTRMQEEAADAHAIEYLAKISYPANGLIELLEFFESQMIGYKDQIDEYLLSHPVSQKRIDLLKSRTIGKKFSDKKINQQLQKQMNIVLAKLEGFMDDSNQLLEKYKNYTDERSNYIKAIALSKKGKIDEALRMLDLVMMANLSDGFLFELRGQILFESGRIQDAAIAYNQAVKLLNYEDSALSKIGFATTILSLKTTDKDLLNLAIKRLQEAKNLEEQNPILFKYLAVAYSKINDEGKSLLELSEFNFLVGDKDKCRRYAKEAKDKLNKSAKADLLRIEDLLEATKESDKKDSNNHL